MDINGTHYTEVEDVVVLMFGKDFKGLQYTNPNDVVQRLHAQMAGVGPIGGKIVQYSTSAAWPGDDYDPDGAPVVCTRPRVEKDCLLVDLGFEDPDLAEAFRKGQYMAILRARGGTLDRGNMTVDNPSVTTVDITETEFLPKNVTARQVAFMYYRELVDSYGVIPQKDTDNAQMGHHIAWMCRELATNAQDMDPDKAHRWIGFIQGWLVIAGSKTVDEIRNATRPFFG